MQKEKKPIFGVGINDYQGAVKINGKMERFYQTWVDMLRRCYDSKYHVLYPAYIGCQVCDEWKYLSNFKKFYDTHYVDGWELDKDLMVKDNKIYSPGTCVFLPKEINIALSLKKTQRGNLPIGVTSSNVEGKYRAQINLHKKRVGLGYFNSVEEAYKAYKLAKERIVRKMAFDYKDQLDIRAYKALREYHINITD